nr:reverse transcriptase domain-containing protein [Tanacetum cinerariifolium]
MPKFAPMFKKLLNNKDKLIELTKTPINENCSAVVLKKLLEKLGDPDDEVDVVGSLRVDNVIQDSEHEYSESKDSDLDNPLLPLPPPEPPDKEFDFEIDFEKEISVMRKLIVKFDVFNAENDVFKFIMFSLLSAESEDTIFDPGISD